MKIRFIKSWLEDFELTVPYVIANHNITSASNVIVEIQLDNGIIGLGAGAPIDFVTGETLEICQQALQADRLEYFVGQSILALPALCDHLAKKFHKTPAARAAIDIALHDAYGQLAGQPLVDVLGRYHHELATSITVGIMGVDETLEAAKSHIQNGFKILKIKLGHNLEEDIERLHKLREHLSGEIGIRVDPNQGYNIQELLQFVDQTKQLNIELIEQPLPVENIDDCRALPDLVKQQLAADESVMSSSDALNLLVPSKACGIFNIKLMKCGGIAPAKNIATIAEVGGVDLMWGCMDESIISITAALHVAFASAKTKYIDLDGSFDLARDLVTGGFVLENGMMRTGEGAGLGLRRLGR